MSEIINLADRKASASGGPNTPGEGTTELPPVFGFGTPEGGLASMDVGAFFNMRDWLQAAREAKGARMTGGGIGCGEADIDVELEGHHYNISIRPLSK